jgi:prepilin-type processing-associated H-X9-DG protein
MNDPTMPERKIVPIPPAAVVSFMLGAASILGFLVLTGLPALWFGWRGLRTINRSDGRLCGARLAVGGMVLGAIGTAVTLLGIAAGIALKLRDTSNRIECADHLRQIGLSLSKYADLHESFPAATRDPSSLPPDRRLSFYTELLPLLGDTPQGRKSYAELAEKIDRTRGWDDPANGGALQRPVRLFLCPGHPDYQPNERPGLTHYVGVAGIDPRAAYLQRTDPRAGAFGHGRGVRRREAERGISHTMMVLETAQDNGPWLAGGHPTVRGLAPDEGHYFGPGRAFGGMHYRVVNVLWMDGSVRQLRDDTPGGVVRSQATLRRGEP